MRRRRAAAALMVCGAAGFGLPVARADDAAPRYAAGAATFQANCAVCHGRDGRGQPSLAPPLTNYPAHYVAAADGRGQLAMTVLYGMFGDIAVEQKHYNFKMPGFAKFSDETLAAVLNYVVFDLAHAAADLQPMTAADITQARQVPATGDAVRQRRLALITALGL